MSAITNTAKRPVLLWIMIGYWMLTGIFGILSILTTYPSLSKFSHMNFVSILFVFTYTLSGPLTLWSGILLVRNMKLTIVPMAIVSMLGLVGILLAGPSYLTSYGTILWVIGLWAIGPLSVAYAQILRKRGVLK